MAFQGSARANAEQNLSYLAFYRNFNVSIMLIINNSAMTNAQPKNVVTPSIITVQL